MARQVPFTSSDSSGFYGGAATVPVIVKGKTGLAMSGMGNTESKKPDKPKDPTPTGSGSTPSTPAKLTAAEKKAARAKRIAEQKAANAAARAEKNNPLLAPYKSPAELRKEAAELAALSVASEESLRTQQGLQETGLTGLTTALSNRLSGVSNDYAGMLRGLQGTYGNVAAGATSAGETALAAAGAPTSTPVAGADPQMASNFAALGAVPATYAGAATLTGAQLIGGSKAKLQDALIARSNTVSANTAKYLQQLRDTEYNKAIAKVTAEQNAARLGVDAEYKAGQLGVAQSRAATAAGQLNRQILKDQKAGKSTGSTIKTVKRGILANPNTWTEPTYSSNDYEWTFALGEGKTATGIGPNRNAAITNAQNSGSMTAADLELNKNNSAWGIQGDPVKVIPKYEDVYAQLMSILVNAGDTPKKASAWIATFMPGVARLPRS